MEDYKDAGLREYYDSGYVSRDTDEKSKYPIVITILAVALVILTITVLADNAAITNLKNNMYEYLDMVEEQRDDIKDLERIILDKNMEMKDLKRTIEKKDKEIEYLQEELKK